MGGVPKQRHTKSRRNKRRSQIILQTLRNAPILSLCPHCHKGKRPHTVCPHCGYYAGREVINTLAKEEKKQKKQKEKATA
jgi:large subunit ribosomal protein L32